MASGLSYTFTSLADTTDDLEFSDNGGATFSYIPTPDAEGYDPNVTDIRVRPEGVFLAAGGGNDPSFTVQFRVRVR